jgi:4-diphosphocytidyl-2-C-methyl-D-erythritol kinase
VQIERTAAGWNVQAPAKLNLFLEVLARRSDGFHEIETLMMPINLFDTLSFQDAPDGQVRLECRWAPGLLKQSGASPEGSQLQNAAWEELPREENNLAHRAVVLLQREAAIQRGARMQLMKRIPSAAGLGGGSSDAAAALVAANVGWGLNWPRARLAALAARLGSDVPFFLGSGPAVCRGRGERIEPIARGRRLHLVVVCPPEGLATAAVYQGCRPADAPRSVIPLVESLGPDDVRKMRQAAFNRLEESACALSPCVNRALRELLVCDCQWAQMSGSGTSCFGVVGNAHQAQRIAARLRARGWSRAMALQTL